MVVKCFSLRQFLKFHVSGSESWLPFVTFSLLSVSEILIVF